MKVAWLWQPAGDGNVQCALCQHRCRIAPGKRGVCGVRENRDGTLYTLVYGRSIAQAVDPIEKKPLYHFLPGSRAFSTATLGCNFRCLHCQNFHISKVPGEEQLVLGDAIEPAALVRMAEASRCASIAYTYTEPTIFFEYAYDTAVEAGARGIRNIFVTNGYITPEALHRIAPHLDAANIDLKFFTDENYRKVCGARLEPVLEAIRLYHQLGIWIELTTLVIPTCNDSADELRQMAEFIAGVDPSIPWHVTQFHPTHRLRDQPRTPAATLELAWRLGREAGLRYVYVGNIRHPAAGNTRCPSCGAAVIERSGFRIESMRLQEGACPGCGTYVEGVWK